MAAEKLPHRQWKNSHGLQRQRALWRRLGQWCAALAKQSDTQELEGDISDCFESSGAR